MIDGRFKPHGPGSGGDDFGDSGPGAVGEHRSARRVIRALPEEFAKRCELLEPIPVSFERVAPSSVVASFREADLSVTGYDARDAEADLVSWIVDMHEDLQSADPRSLGPLPTRQKRILERHLRRRA